MAGMRTGIHEALSLFGQAGVFFGRHYAVIAAFCVPAALQRFLAVGGGAERFGPIGAVAAGWMGELTTIALRLGLVAWLVGKRFRGISRADASRGLSEFLDAHVPMLLASVGLLILLSVVANAVPAVLRSGLDDSARRSFLAWELAIKNMTLIPFVLVWVVMFTRMAVGGSEPMPRN